MTTVESRANDPWIAVDLDGTLAHYDKFISPTHVGEVIEPMAARIRKWTEAGRVVVIYTARMTHPEGDPDLITAAIQDWLAQNDMPRLDVIGHKDYRINEFWDDRAVSVEPNTGRALSWRVVDADV